MGAFPKKKARWFLVKTNTVFFTLIRELSHFSIHSKDFVWKKNERIKKKELLNFTFYLFKLSLVQKWFGRIIYNFTCASRVKKKLSNLHKTTNFLNHYVAFLKKLLTHSTTKKKNTKPRNLWLNTQWSISDFRQKKRRKRTMKVWVRAKLSL